MKLNPLSLFTLCSTLVLSVVSLEPIPDYNRPLFHLTADHGWINDPNGLWYDRKEKLWHAYYQHSKKTVHSLPISWGHSTSKDLMNWEFQGDALSPNNDEEGIFSGSAVVDRNNTSGFFNETTDPEQRLVAVYTRHTEDSQTQEVAYSYDAGYSFIKYGKNPVIDVNTTQQRDPKMFWHEESEQWILLVAKSQEYKVQIYASPNLKEWELKSNFTLHGTLGFQYECPAMMYLPIENPQDDEVTHKWVLVLAINPGSPIGGSINQYFIGDFDGTEFKADDAATRFMDIGKDYYAFQNFENTDPEDGAIGLAWASNWQYGNLVPTEPWRHSQSLARKHTLRYISPNPENTQLGLIQRPFFETKETEADSDIKGWEVYNEFEIEDEVLNNKSNIATGFESERNSSGVFDFNLTFTVGEATDTVIGKYFSINILSQVVQGTRETIEVAFDPSQTTWFIDRGTGNPFQRNSPQFAERMSIYHQYQSTDDEGNTYHIYGFVDRNILELYLNNGESTSTNTFFFSQNKIPSSIELVTDVGDDELFTINSLKIRELGKN